MCGAFVFCHFNFFRLEENLLCACVLVYAWYAYFKVVFVSRMCFLLYEVMNNVYLKYLCLSFSKFLCFVVLAFKEFNKLSTKINKLAVLT